MPYSDLDRKGGIVPVVIIVAVVAAIVCMMGFAIWASTAAKAHSFYSPACCSDRDCAPVADGVVEEMRDGIHVEGHGIMSRTDPRIHTSLDDRDHLCIIGGKIRCLYMRPKGT